MPEFVSDEEFIQRAKSNDKQAFSELYDRYIDRIYRYVAYRLPLEDTENLAAEIFARMVERITGFEDTVISFEVWLYRLASACVTDFQRLRAYNLQAQLAENLGEIKPQPEKLLVKQETKPIHEALLRLDPEDQEILILRFVERKSQKEVAEIMDKHEPLVRNDQYQALKRLARLGLG